MYVLHTVVWRWKRADRGLCTSILFQMPITNTILDLSLLKIVVAGLPMHAMGTATKSPSLSDFQLSSVRPPFILSERVSDMTSGRRMDFLSLIPGIVVAAAVPDRPTATGRQTAREGAGIGIVNSIDPSPTLPQTAIAAMGRDGREMPQLYHLCAL